MYYPAYSVFLLNNSSYRNYYQTYMLEYIGQTLLDSVICGACKHASGSAICIIINYTSKIYH